MGLEQIEAGTQIPDDINVIIEIPARSEPIKYEMDKRTGALVVDRFMATCMYYPCDYGYIPSTLSKDGDPVDVLVLTPVPVNRGCLIRCRPIGLLKMTDESGEDIKILAVPINRLTTLYQHIQKPDDVSPLLLNQIVHFFTHYKDLEEGKWVKLDGWCDAKAAKQEIEESIERYQNLK